MPLDERALRMNQLKKRERKMDVDAWVKDFLFHMGSLDSDRDRLAAGPNQLYPTLCGPDERFATDIEQCTKMGIVIDFDGTLSYLARFA